MAFAVLLGVGCYLRPNELLRLQPHNLVEPSVATSAHWSLLMFRSEEQDRSKTNDSDDSLTVDCKWLEWAGPIFEELSRGKAGQSIWPFCYPSFLAQFKLASKALGLGLVPYLMRHSGPSIDRAKGWRSQAECQKRGRWRSWKSLVRYEKAARLGVLWGMMNKEAKDYCLVCERGLGDLVLGRPAAARATGQASSRRASTLRATSGRTTPR